MQGFRSQWVVTHWLGHQPGQVLLLLLELLLVLLLQILLLLVTVARQCG
jgi:hypothetical protein